ncbi:hypothetical protein Ddye_017030 [Dipteronia dyeriana]|uniref:DUF1985 domain-containing protein n=1 Tax=Dipteronia dyeriana TaxID=168575 RepID=A0AAD9U7U9_9ROSI|nr:hypothetical protein Ddye_017030 [Dipteronia dyeriana]
MCFTIIRIPESFGNPNQSSRHQMRTIRRLFKGIGMEKAWVLTTLARIDDALNRVPKDFAVEDRCLFMASCFGHFMLMHRDMKFSGGVIHRLLLRELDHDRPTDEMRFLLENHVVRFSKVEFYLILGLRFGVVPDIGLYAVVENDIHQRYFPRADKVSMEELRVVITLGKFQEAYDAVKLYLIYMLKWILIEVGKKFKILVWQFRLVEDLTVFDAFPRGAHVYSYYVYNDIPPTKFSDVCEGGNRAHSSLGGSTVLYRPKRGEGRERVLVCKGG